jgi:hypothetical protein
MKVDIIQRLIKNFSDLVTFSDNDWDFLNSFILSRTGISLDLLLDILPEYHLKKYISEFKRLCEFEKSACYKYKLEITSNNITNDFKSYYFMIMRNNVYAVVDENISNTAYKLFIDNQLSRVNIQLDMCERILESID